MKPAPEQETIEIRQPFVGVVIYCHRCRLEQIAPWVPARCCVCGYLLYCGEVRE